MNTSIEQNQKIIQSFERLVMTPRPIRLKIAEQTHDGTVPPVKNRFARKGLESQKRRKGSPTGKSHLSENVGSGTSIVREQALHEAIVAHPFLFHTPELYAGGLHLDTLLNKYRLPSGHITDFTYITVQDRVIKITLVEIEQASKGVFNNPIGSRSSFRYETEAAINQVRSWRKEMQHEATQKALLRNLRSLFAQYPVAIFDSAGYPSSLACIEMSYVLVVGNERPQSEAHQRLIDQLYMQDGIIFMTYPLMLDQIRKKPHHKNVLKLGLYKMEPMTVSNAASLRTISQELGLPQIENDDPYGTQLAGLGWQLHIGQDKACAMHPASIKALFYRSNGICEKPGCSRKIIEDDEATGGLSPIYNVIDDDSDYETFWNTDNVALACADHQYRFNGDEHHALGKPHPLNESMTLRKPYRGDLDQQALSFTRSWQVHMADGLLELMEIDPDCEPKLSADMHAWLLAVKSLPWRCQVVLSSIVDDYYRGHRRSGFRDARHLANRWDFNYLMKAGVIRLNHLAKRGQEIEPAVFSPELMERVDALFGSRAWSAIPDLCKGNVRGLASELERARKEAAKAAEEAEKQERLLDRYRYS